MKELHAKKIRKEITNISKFPTVAASDDFNPRATLPTQAIFLKESLKRFWQNPTWTSKDHIPGELEFRATKKAYGEDSIILTCIYPYIGLGTSPGKGFARWGSDPIRQVGSFISIITGQIVRLKCGQENRIIVPQIFYQTSQGPRLNGSFFLDENHVRFSGVLDLITLKRPSRLSRLKMAPNPLTQYADTLYSAAQNEGNQIIIQATKAIWSLAHR